MPFGDTINAGLMNPDYSGIERAGAAKGAGYSAIGQGISNAMEAFGDYKKQQNEQKKVVKQADLYIDAAIKIFPELESSLQNARITIQDEDNPLSDRFAAAESIQGLLNMGFQGMKAKSERLDSMMAYEADMAKLAADREPKYPDTMNFPRPDGSTILGFRRGNQYFDVKGNLLTTIGGSNAEPSAQPPSAPGVDPGLDPLPDNMKTVADNIGAAVELTEGTTVDGEPGVLPRRENPAIDGLGHTPATQAQLQTRIMTQEEFSSLVSQGIKAKGTLLPDGMVQVSGVEVGGSSGLEMETIHNPDGTVTTRVGPGGGNQQKHDPAAFREQTKREGASYMLDEAARFMTDLENIPQGEGVPGAVMRLGLSYVPGSSSGKAKTRMQVFKDAIAFDSLSKMRLSSPTGGALGSVSNAEGQRLENAYGAINLALPPTELKQKTTRFIRDYVNVIYGTDQQIETAVKEGKVTPEAGAQARAMREQAFAMTISGKTTGIDERGQIQQPQVAPLVDPRIQEKIDFLNNLPR